MSASLQKLVERARHAGPNERIDLRDALAAHGATAIEAMTEWLTDPSLTRFAVRVIGKAGDTGARTAAIKALQEALPHVDGSARIEVDAALDRLGLRREVTMARESRVPREPRTWPNRRLGHPYSEVGEFRVLNTSHHNDPRDDSYMLGEHRAAAFFSPWKEKIEAIAPGDLVYFYTATGPASSRWVRQLATSDGAHTKGARSMRTRSTTASSSRSRWSSLRPAPLRSRMSLAATIAFAARCLPLTWRTASDCFFTSLAASRKSE